MEEGFTTHSLVALNESESGSSLLYSIAEILETTSEHTVVQMFSSSDNVTWLRTDQRKTVPLFKIIVNNITMTKKNSLRQKNIEIIYRHVNIQQ